MTSEEVLYKLLVPQVIRILMIVVFNYHTLFKIVDKSIKTNILYDQLIFWI